MIAWSRYNTPFGYGAVVCDDDRISCIVLPPQNGKSLEQLVHEDEPQAPARPATSGFSAEIAPELEKYFAEGKVPPDLLRKVLWPSLTSSQEAVLRACAAIPRGKVLAYWELAREAGMKNPRSCGRFVGNVMATNRLPLVVPCHRVVTSDYRVGNYGGGAEMKRWLLTREGALSQLRP